MEDTFPVQWRLSSKYRHHVMRPTFGDLLALWPNCAYEFERRRHTTAAQRRQRCHSTLLSLPVAKERSTRERSWVCSIGGTFIRRSASSAESPSCASAPQLSRNMGKDTPVIDVQRPANGGEAIDNIATWYVWPACELALMQRNALQEKTDSHAQILSQPSYPSGAA